MCPIHTADVDGLNCRVASRRRCVQHSQLAHEDCRRIRSTLCKLNIAVDYVNFDRY